MNLRSVSLQNHTTVRQHCITTAITDTAHTKGGKPAPTSSTLGTHEMYQTQQELMKRQGNKPENSYIELAPGTPIWVQHRQNATWEPATVINQCAPNSCWIMQENGTEQPKVYGCTRTMLKIRSTPTDVEQTGHMRDWLTETRKSESNIPAIPNTV